MFKWICLAVTTLGLVAFLWMVNDVRLRITGLADRVDAKLPPLEEKAERIDGKLTTLLADSNQAVSTINARLPRIMDKTEQSVDNLAQLSEDLKQSKELLGSINSIRQNKDLATYAVSLLSLIQGQRQATIGSKKQETDKEMKPVAKAQDWAKSAGRDANFLSLIAKSKGEVLDRLTKSASGAPLYIQMAEKAAPVLLQTWLKANHPESKNLE
jgi:uncharacterized phage infection (PIP) family protein YhgE